MPTSQSPFAVPSAALNKGFELYRETHSLKCVLEFLLLVVVTVNCVGCCRDNLAVGADAPQEFLVIELATVCLPAGVVDVLHVGKNGDFLHVWDRD